MVLRAYTEQQILYSRLFTILASVLGCQRPREGRLVVVGLGKLDRCAVDDSAMEMAKTGRECCTAGRSNSLVLATLNWSGTAIAPVCKGTASSGLSCHSKPLERLIKSCVWFTTLS